MNTKTLQERAPELANFPWYCWNDDVMRNSESSNYDKCKEKWQNALAFCRENPEEYYCDEHKGHFDRWLEGHVDFEDGAGIFMEPSE